MAIVGLSACCSEQHQFSCTLVPYLGLLSPIRSSALPLLPASNTLWCPPSSYTSWLIVVIELQPLHLHTFP